MIVREAKVSDAAGIAFVHVESWKTSYQNILPKEFLTNLSYKSREQFWETSIPKGNVFVAENDEGKIVGFASGGNERSGSYEGYKGELTSIYILKSIKV